VTKRQQSKRARTLNRGKPGNYQGPFVTWMDLPDARLSPNARTHWRLKAKLVKDARLLGRSVVPTAAQSCVGWHAVSIKTTFHVPTKRRRDVRNLDSNHGLKAYIDGFVDAGLLVDDDKITWLPSEIVIEPGCWPVVKIEVWPGDVIKRKRAAS